MNEIKQTCLNLAVKLSCSSLEGRAVATPPVSAAMIVTIAKEFEDYLTKESGEKP